MSVSKRLAAQEAKVAAAAQKLEEAKAKKRALETAAKARERTAARKEETRQKVVSGAFFLDRARASGKDPLDIQVEGMSMREWITRESEMSLFAGKPPAPKPAPAPAPKPAAPKPAPAAPAPTPNFLSQFQQSAPAPAKVASEPVYLDVPYDQRDAVKAYGARWDGERKKWFVPAGSDLAAFSRWLP